MRIIVTAALLLPALAFAGSPFDGTWKARLDSVKMSGKPDVFQVANGDYSCASCVPAVKIKADGVMHKVEGHPYYDELAVRIIDATTLEMQQKRAGKINGSVTYTVSKDGDTLSGKFTDDSGAQTVTGQFTETRVAAAGAGSHATSGSWMQTSVSDINDAGTTLTYESSGDHFRMRANGQSYDAKFDGKQYPVVGDPGHRQVSLKRLDANTIEETDYLQGKVSDEIRLATAADGKTMILTDKDVLHGQTSTMTFDKL